MDIWDLLRYWVPIDVSMGVGKEQGASEDGGRYVYEYVYRCIIIL